MSTMTVQMLGGFEIRVDGKPALTSLYGSRKAMAVLQYLLMRKGEKVSHQVLIDAIWRQDNAGNPDMALRAILHRIRKAADAEGVEALGKCILTTRGSYQWNPTVDCTTDVERMLQCAADAANTRSESQRNKQSAKVVALYKGRLLPGQSGEAWVEGNSVRLHGIYRGALMQQIEMMKQQDWQPQLEALCRKALELDAYDERLYLELIMALEKQGKREEAGQVAHTGAALGCLHRDLTPHLATNACGRIGRLDVDTGSELKRIADELQEACGSGAQACSYVIFRELYSIQRGIQARHGLPLFLGLLTLSAHADTEPGAQETAMTQLGDLLSVRLRQSDVYARYGANQYVVMLSGGYVSTEEGVPAPLERIKAAFYQTAAGNMFQLGYCLHSVDIRSEEHVQPEKPGKKAKK